MSAASVYGERTASDTSHRYHPWVAVLRENMQPIAPMGGATWVGEICHSHFITENGGETCRAVPCEEEGTRARLRSNRIIAVGQGDKWASADLRVSNNGHAVLFFHPPLQQLVTPVDK